MEPHKIIVILKENWNMPKFLKVPLLQALHKYYSIREIAKLLDKGTKTIHWYLKYQTRDSIELFLIPYIVEYQDIDTFSQLNEIINELPSAAPRKSLIQPNNGYTSSHSGNGDDEKRTQHRGDKYEWRSRMV